MKVFPKRTKLTIRRLITVKRSDRPYYEEQGWKQSKGTWFSGDPKFTGYYRTPYGSFKGEILTGSSPSFFIIKPPKELKSHSHWICFSYRGSGRYSIHFAVRPRDVDSGIMRIERMIHEAFTLAK